MQSGHGARIEGIVCFDNGQFPLIVSMFKDSAVCQQVLCGGVHMILYSELNQFFFSMFFFGDSAGVIDRLYHRLKIGCGQFLARTSRRDSPAALVTEHDNHDGA